MSENEMFGWQHQLNGHEPGQTPRDGGGQADLVCCSPWCLQESDTTEQLRLSLSFHKKPTFRPMASNDLPEVCVRGGYGPQVYLLTQQTLSTHSFD